MTESPKIGRIEVRTYCICGAEVEFSDVDPDGAYESVLCDDCGQRVEISVCADIQMRTP